MKTHRPLLSIAFSFVTGILIASAVSLPFPILGMAAFLFFLLSRLFIRRKMVSPYLLMVSFVLLGMIRLQNHLILPKEHVAHVTRYYKREMVAIEGVVISDVQRRPFFKGKKNIFTLEVRRFKTPWGWQEKNGKVLVQIFRETPVQYGDYLSLKGKLYRPFNFSKEEKFSYREYLERKGIKLILSVGKQGEYQILRSHQGSRFKAVSYRLKQRLAKIFTEHLTANEAAIMIGIILGDRYLIAPHINELFIQTGTAHILAISGFNVGIVAFIIFVVLKAFPIPRRGQYSLTIVFLIFYAFLTGGQPSVVRATIMASIFLLSFLFEKEAEAVNSLALAALMILMMNPMNLFDVGFQLSFISVLAIICVHPGIMRVFPQPLPHHDVKILQLFLQSLSVSVAVWFWVAGLVAYYFQIMTPITILANLVIVPISTLVIILGFGMIFLTSLWPPLAIGFAACIKVTLNLMVASLYLLSQVPFAYLYTKEVSLTAVGIYYGVLFLVTATPTILHGFSSRPMMSRGAK